jgi:CubicO group peptidase (beta-lactamase class C family)
MRKKVLEFTFKTFHLIFYTLIGLVIAVNLFIVLSGRFYIYKGMVNTYFKGRLGPGIYDLDVFPYSTIKRSTKPYIWQKSENYNEFEQSKEIQRLNRLTETAALLVIKDDKLVYEKYYGEHHSETLSNSFSAAKTIVSLLVGVALQEGYIKSLDQKVSEFIPEFKKESTKDITLRNLLQMSSGLNWQESGKNPLSENAESYFGTDLYGLVTRQNGIQEPGKKLLYQSGNSQLLGFIVSKTTGKTLSEYAQEKIWQKIGSDANAHWSLDKKKGSEKAFCCIYARARDFAKLGKLIAQKGEWEGETLISKEYMKEMFTPNQNLITEENTVNNRYGLHIWVYQDGEDQVVYCRGILGQYIVVIPEKNLIFVRLGHKRMTNVSPIDCQKSDNEGEIFTTDQMGHPRDFFQYLQFAKEASKGKD